MVEFTLSPALQIINNHLLEIRKDDLFSWSVLTAKLGSDRSGKDCLEFLWNPLIGFEAVHVVPCVGESVSAFIETNADWKC